MKPESEHDRPSQPIEPLDELLDQAEWPEPDESRVRRLAGRWQTVRRADRRRTLAVRLFAVVAGLVACVAGWWIRQSAPEPVGPEVAEHEVRSDVDDAPVPGVPKPGRLEPGLPPVPTFADNHTIPESDRARLPNDYERVAFHTTLRRRQRGNREQVQAALIAVVRQCLSDEKMDVAALTNPLQSHREVCEELICRWIPKSSSDARAVQVRLLEHLGGRRCVPLMARCLRDRKSAPAATRVLRRVADEQTLGRLIVAESHVENRNTLLHGLIERGTPNSARVILELVANRDTRTLTLTAIRQSKQPPVRHLFPYLDSNVHEQKLAAALALGQVDRPEVTERLIQLAMSDSHRNEAFVALLASPAVQADRFLRFASRQSQFHAAVSSARSRLQMVIQ